MDQETVNILNEFRESLLQELDVYCQYISNAANVQMNYEKKHPEEIHVCPVSMTYLGQYYGYNGARDVVNEVYNNFLNEHK